jgi:response regulator of citrate/malate metabolism
VYGIYLIDVNRKEIEKTKRAVDWMDYGFEVVGMNTDPAAATIEIMAIKPDLVILGTQKPHTDGIAFMKAIHNAGLSTEFVMLTSWWNTVSMGDVFNSGGLDYLLKPFDKTKAEDLIGRYIKKQARAPDSCQERDRGDDQAI